MNDRAWDNLLMRLKAVANNCQVSKSEQSYSGRKKYEHGGEGAALIELELFYAGSVLLGWSRPERIPLEPKSFDVTVFDLQPVKGWERVIIDLKGEKGVRVCKTLVVRDGQPVGWMKEAIVLPVMVAA